MPSSNELHVRDATQTVHAILTREKSDYASPVT